uniref:Hypothetical transmebrane protein n=1 Tax=Trypanosoma brucei TaxID=5691 RepID=Q8WPU4_9TRYP|nr:hypothetical transmebrane protein [Trypanosoma brucei]
MKAKQKRPRDFYSINSPVLFVVVFLLSQSILAMQHHPASFPRISTINNFQYFCTDCRAQPPSHQFLLSRFLLPSTPRGHLPINTSALCVIPPTHAVWAIYTSSLHASSLRHPRARCPVTISLATFFLTLTISNHANPTISSNPFTLPLQPLHLACKATHQPSKIRSACPREKPQWTKEPRDKA